MRLVLVLLLAVGCRDGESEGTTPDPEPDREPTERAPAPADAASASSPGTFWEAAARIEVPGFEKRPGRETPGPRARARFLEEEANQAGKRIQARVSLAPCERDRCPDLSDPGLRAKSSLERALPQWAREDPDLVLEAFRPELAGERVFAVYARSFVASEWSAKGLHELRVIHHDGLNRITIVLAPKSEDRLTAKSSADLRRELPKEDLLAAAETILSAYAGLFL